MSFKAFILPCYSVGSVAKISIFFRSSLSDLGYEEMECHQVDDDTGDGHV